MDSDPDTNPAAALAVIRPACHSVGIPDDDQWVCFLRSRLCHFMATCDLTMFDRVLYLYKVASPSKQIQSQVPKF